MAVPRFRLIAIDLDGTLLDSRGKLPSRNRAALHRAHEAGLRVVLCTGRSYTETRGVIQEIGLDLDATITVGGALINDARSGATIESAPIDARLAQDAVAWFQRRDYAVLWLHDRHRAGFDGYAIEGNRRHAAIDVWLAGSGCAMRTTTAMPDELHPPLRITIIDSEQALNDISPEFSAAFESRLAHNVIHVPVYGFSVIEAFAHRVDKWYGIERLCERWSIDPRSTIAIGDDVNDVPMLRQAGAGYAVANARPAALDATPLRTGRNDDCGVAEVIEALLDN